MTAQDRTANESRPAANPSLHRLAMQIAGRHWQSASPEALASLLLPIVRRVIQTGRGPTALLRWVVRVDTAEPAAIADRKARSLTDNLVQFLLEPREVQRDTVRN